MQKDLVDFESNLAAYTGAKFTVGVAMRQMVCRWRLWPVVSNRDRTQCLKDYSILLLLLAAC